jgi:predicted RNA-binding protein (virulence factor B family)
VDDIYSARIPAKDLVKSLRIGERPTLRVSKVLPDGKLELSMREPAHLQINEDCERILNELKASEKGFLPYHDKTESLILKNKFNMSKNSFKRAIGHLYKEGLITIYSNGIELK